MPHELIGQESFGLLLLRYQLYNRKTLNARLSSALISMLRSLCRAITVLLVLYLIGEPNPSIFHIQKTMLASFAGPAISPYLRQALAPCSLDGIQLLSVSPQR